MSGFSSFADLPFQSSPPCGGRLNCAVHRPNNLDISIHAPRAGGRPSGIRSAIAAGYFNPRPRAGGDRCLRRFSDQVRDFNPRPPCGGRRLLSFSFSFRYNFNPRPRAGGDHAGALQEGIVIRFQSTPPCGGRRLYGIRHRSRSRISIHAPVRGATLFVSERKRDELISIHAPVRGATSTNGYRCGLQSFQSTPPCGGRR